MAEDLDSPRTLSLTPCLGPPPDHQHPPDTASVPATAPPAFPDVAASPTVPDVAASPAVSHVVAELPEVSAPPTTARKATGKRKKSLAVKKLAAVQEKLDFLSQNLRPVPFSPGCAPDLGLHERFFRVLGLWDFAHLNLAADPLRPDLLADLIANYTPSSRSSKVCGVRIGISRADLARALALPVKKTVTPTKDELTLFMTEEATTVLTSFVQDWIVVMEDACVVPREVVLTTDMVKMGHAYKVDWVEVDWAGLVWTMVEKELKQATKSGQCLYASHLQRLIKHQRPELFKAEAVVVSEPEVLVELVAAVEEDGGNVTPTEEEGDPSAAPLVEQDDQNAAKTTALEDFPEQEDQNATTKSGQCLYASHIQRLIKHQRPELFKAEAVVVSEPEVLVELVAAVEEDGGNVAPTEEEGDPSAASLADQNAGKTTALEDFPEQEDQNAATKSGQCLYGSHLQRLIKHQQPELFKAEVVVVFEPELLVELVAAVEEDGGNVAPTAEEGDPSAAPLAEQEDQNATKTTALEDFPDVDVDANGPQLNLGLGFEVDAMLGLEENCDAGVELQWLTDENDGGSSSHYMQGCCLDDLTAVDCDTFVKEEDHGGGAEDRQFEIKFNGLEQMNSMDLLQVVTDGNVSYNMQHSLGQSSGDFLVTETRTHKNVASGSGPASLFSCGRTHKNVASGSGPASLFSCGKRDIDEIDAGNEVDQFSQINLHKKMRREGKWGGNHGTTSSFTADFEQMQLRANKIKMDYLETVQAYANAQLQLHYANAQLQQKDQMIHSLEKARMEEAQKRELEACRFEHELRLLTHVVSGYKSALKQTRNVFAEYRKKFPQGEEARYKDVEGIRGLVLSTGEIERLEQLKKEEDTCCAAEVKLLGERGGEASCSRNDN